MKKLCLFVALACLCVGKSLAVLPPEGTFEWGMSVPFVVDYKDSITLSITSATVSNFTVTYELADHGLSQYVDITGNVLKVKKHYPGTCIDGSSGHSEDHDIVIVANISGMAEYEDMYLTATMQTRRISPGLRWNTQVKDMTYGSTQQLSVVHNNGDSAVNIVYDSYDAISSPSFCVSIDNSTGVMTATELGNGIIVKALICQTDNYNADTISYPTAINVTKGYRDISWDSTDLSGLNNLSGKIKVDLRYGDQADYYTVESSNLRIASFQNGYINILDTGTVKLTARVFGTDNYFEASKDTAIHIAAAMTTAEWEDNFIAGLESYDYISSTLKDYNLNYWCKSNYGDEAKFYFKSLNPDIASINNDTLLTCYKTGALEIEAYATAKGGQSATIRRTVNVARGKMQFVKPGDWDDNACWSRPDLKPNSTDYVVEILAKCRIKEGTEADCYRLTVFANGSLSLDPGAELFVEDSIINNSEEQYLKLGADNAKQSYLRFKYGEPKARVQRYLDMKIRNGEDTIWSYCGAPGKDVVMRNLNLKKRIQWWNDGKWESERQMLVSMNAWKGYRVADSIPTIYDFDCKLQSGNHSYDLTYRETNDDKGRWNFITNSYSAPIEISEMQFYGANSEVYFYNGERWVSSPKFMASVLGYPYSIEPGQGVFVRSKESGAHVDVDYENAVWNPSIYETNTNILKIAVRGIHSKDTVALVVNSGNSDGYDDGYDGEKWTDAELMPMIYVTNKWGKASVNASESIVGQKIGFKAGIGGETYTIGFDTKQLGGFKQLYLFDLKTQAFVDVLAGEEYSFTGDVLGEDERFTLMTEKVDIQKSKGRSIVVIGNRVLLVGFDGSNIPVRVMTMDGKIVYQFMSSDGPWVELPSLLSGVYMINAGKTSTKFYSK